jgi:hypothetical protein
MPTTPNTDGRKVAELRAQLRAVLDAGQALSAYGGFLAREGCGTRDAMRSLVAAFDTAAEKARHTLREK